MECHATSCPARCASTRLRRSSRRCDSAEDWLSRWPTCYSVHRAARLDLPNHSVRLGSNHTDMCSLVCTSPEGPAAAGGTDVEQPKSLEALEREICALAAHLAAATCRWLLLVAEFDAREGWAEWGVTSCAHWLSWRCGIGLTAAREHVRVARVIRGLPLVQGEFAAGVLTYSKVRTLTRVASEKGAEAELVELARHATGAQLEKLCRQYGRVLEPRHRIRRRCMSARR